MGRAARRGLRTMRHRVGAPWMEGTAARRVNRIGVAGTQLGIGHTKTRVGCQHRIKQRPRIGMLWIAKQGGGLGLFDNTSQIHHRNAAGDMFDDRQIVADDDVGEVKFCPQVIQQIQDLRLHRDVKRRCRLITYNYLGSVDQGAGDGDTLALAT